MSAAIHRHSPVFLRYARLRRAFQDPRHRHARGVRTLATS